MKKIGKVINITKEGHVTLSLLEMPRIGEELYTKTGAVAGRVSRIFGSVKEPYCSVKPSINQKILYTLIDDYLYGRG